MLMFMITPTDGSPNCDKVIPLFITIDPERDDVETMAAYVKGMYSEVISVCRILGGVFQFVAQWGEGLYFPSFKKHTRSWVTLSYLG